LPPKEQILDFLDKNSLTVKDLREITGKGDSTVRDWFDWLKGNEKKSKFPKEIWLLLNALFNRNASFVIDIIREYSKGDAFMENPELVRKFHDEIQVIEETVRSWNEMNQMDRKEEIITNLHEEHLDEIKEKWNNAHGLGGLIRIQDRDVYTQIRKKEKELDIVTGVAIEDLENLSDRYSSGGKDDGFIKELLKIYDDYMAGVEELRLFKYIDKLKNATEEDIRVIYGKRGKASKKRPVVGRYLADTPEQAKEVETIHKSTLYHMEKKSDIKNSFQEEQEAIFAMKFEIARLRKELAELKKERDGYDNEPVVSMTPASREKMQNILK